MAEDGGPVAAAPDPDDCCTSWTRPAAGSRRPRPPRQVSSLLGGRHGWPSCARAPLEVGTDERRAPTPEVAEVDLRDPLAAGLFDLDRGPAAPRRPARSWSTRPSPTRATRLGDTLDLPLTDAPTTRRSSASPSRPRCAATPFAAGPMGSPRPRRRGARRPGWSTAARCRGPTSGSSTSIGATVVSRAVIDDPPPASEQSAERACAVQAATTAAWRVLALDRRSWSLLEVVLLAGPAFAVGARQQQRSLALMAASGGTPRQSRRVVLGRRVRPRRRGRRCSGVVLGIVVGRGRRAGRCSASRRPRSGPFDVPWLPPGRGRGVRAAQRVPRRAWSRPASPRARTSSRCWPVAAATRRPRCARRCSGVVLLGVGIAGSVFGARARPAARPSIAASAPSPPCSG